MSAEIERDAGVEATLSQERLCAVMVEDDPTHVALMERAFERTGIKWAIVVVTNLESAREVLSGPTPDAVLLDINLGDENGLDLLPWMRSRAELADVPVAVISGALVGDPAAEAMSRGASLFLPKPWTLREYERTVERLVYLLRESGRVA